MKSLRHTFAFSFLALVAAVLQYGATGCSGNDPAACSVDAPGKPFTFHVHNVGTRKLRLTKGCGSELPITLDTPMGTASIGSGDCATTCEDLYAGGPSQPGFGCADCGTGMGLALEPGKTATLTWDRRVYVKHDIDTSCGDYDRDSCSLAQTVAATAAQKGVLGVCADEHGDVGDGRVSGFCIDDEETTAFTVDTTGDETTIEVQ
ncbi:hypothetical protein [Polyangium aurulentum]|uniref:hypothetical protein n=1 Tax=Polyangium aurulentum TaxID=2567896 RepID=UPI0010AE0A21|nr:hypothetical protein [Polyangium aurulentum]UQA59376.1 hypothetical protein E8A73_002380 [Polyangium aurulentum]